MLSHMQIYVKRFAKLFFIFLHFTFLFSNFAFTLDAFFSKSTHKYLHKKATKLLHPKIRMRNPYYYYTTLQIKCQLFSQTFFKNFCRKFYLFFRTKLIPTPRTHNFYSFGTLVYPINKPMIKIDAPRVKPDPLAL